MATLPNSPDSSWLGFRGVSEIRDISCRASFELILSVIASVAFLVSCSDESADHRKIAPDKIMAEVDGEPISFEDLRTTAAKNGYDLYGVDGTEKAMRDSINFELLAAQAEEEDYFDDPEVRRMVRGLAVQKLLADRIDEEIGNTVLDDAELEAFYEERKETEFSQPTLARARVLHLMPVEKGASTLESKRKKVEEAFSAGKTFAEVVKELSDNPADRSRGGDTNWLTEGDSNKRYLQEVLDAIFRLKEADETAGPIETGKGLFWVQLVERREGRTTPYNEAKRSIGQRVYRQKRLNAYDGYLKKLRDGYSVKEFPERLSAALKEDRGGSSGAPGPPMGPVTLPASQ